MSRNNGKCTNKIFTNLSVPFRADVDMGTCWGDMRDPDWEGEEEE